MVNKPNKIDPRFLAFVSMTIAWETGGDKAGGYTNDPKDKGGETKWGISKKSYPHLNIKSLTFNDAMRIYQNDYWDDRYATIDSDAIAFKLFDMGVVCGTKKARKALQQSVKHCGITIATDGVIGPVSVAAINSLDADLLYNTYIDKLESHFKWVAFIKPTNKKFLKGWLRRLGHKWADNITKK